MFYVTLSHIFYCFGVHLGPCSCGRCALLAHLLASEKCQCKGMRGCTCCCRGPFHGKVSLPGAESQGNLHEHHAHVLSPVCLVSPGGIKRQDHQSEGCAVVTNLKSILHQVLVSSANLQKQSRNPAIQDFAMTMKNPAASMESM